MKFGDCKSAVELGTVEWFGFSNFEFDDGERTKGIDGGWVLGNFGVVIWVQGCDWG